MKVDIPSKYKVQRMVHQESEKYADAIFRELDKMNCRVLKLEEDIKIIYDRLK